MKENITTLLLFCFFFVSSAIKAQPQVYLVGTATEHGQAIAMQPIAPDGKPKGIYELFTLLRKGKYSLQISRADGSKSIIGRGSKGTTKVGGKAWKSTEPQVVRLRYDSNTRQFNIMPAAISVRGNIIESETILPYVGDGVFKGEVEMDKSEPEIFSQKYFYFTINGNDSLSICRQKGSRESVAMPAEGYDTEPIRINQGSYEISLDANRHTWQADAPIDEYKISVFGSSVANGQGAELNHGYAYQYGKRLEQRPGDSLSPLPFHTSGIAIGGNTTKNLLDRYDEMTHDFGRYVIIGLSMANEGLSRTADKESVYRQFSANMQQIVSMIRADGKVPLVTNNYANNDYSALEYAYIQRINHDIHLWNVPSINLLGAIDRGDGHWADGYWDDNWHPNTAGHEEMSYSIPPSLFDALAANKPLPERQTATGITLTGGASICYKPEGTLHSFTLTIKVKADKPTDLLSFAINGGTKNGAISLDSDGKLSYTSPTDGQSITSEGSFADADWHYITLTHYYASGRTLLYVDSNLVASHSEQFALKSLTLSNNKTDTPLHIAEIFLWRAGMNQSEIASVANGEMLKSSLEIYSPFTAAESHRLSTATEPKSISNLAQSLATMKYNGR